MSGTIDAQRRAFLGAAALGLAAAPLAGFAFASPSSPGPAWAIRPAPRTCCRR